MNLNDIRDSYSDYNKRNHSDRITSNSVMERWILSTMNWHGFLFDGIILNEWEKCDKVQDMKHKNDLQQIVGDKTYYTQIKWRQPNSGSDIQVAVIQPFKNSSLLREAIKTTTIEEQKFWARDMKFSGHIYAVLDNTWENLMIIDYKKVKNVVRKTFKDWIESKCVLGPNNRVYIPNSDILSDNGVQLRYTSDKGKGWDSGDGKILCYIPPKVFSDVQVLKMVDFPVDTKDSE